MYDKIVKYYARWSEHKFLTKHGCKTREEYNRWYDPLCDARANTVEQFYRDYKFVYCFENHKHSVYEFDVENSGMSTIHKWCNENSVGKLRFDSWRVIKQTNADFDDSSKEKTYWFLNDISGSVYIFAAFTEEVDYTMFLLRWT